MPRRTYGRTLRVTGLTAACAVACWVLMACGGQSSGSKSSLGDEGRSSPESSGSRISRVQIDHIETPSFGGHEFGAVGQYEAIIGRAFGELDPSHPLNSGIVNLERAPRNANGWVDYSSDFYILRPVEPSRGNGTLFYDVLNRGNKLGLQMFQGGSTNDLKTLAARGRRGSS